MARIRSVHPGLYTDDAFMALSMAARMFFIGIWTEADDQGAFAWKPFVLKARIFPADNVDVDGLLNELLSVGLIMKADADGSHIGLVKNFCKWQRPQKPSLFFDIPENLRSFVGLNDEKEGDSSRKKAIWARFSGRCFYCSAEVSYYSKRHNSLEIDHIIPVSKGGTNDESNLVCSCRGCNRAKSDMSAQEFFAFRKLKKLPISEGFAEQFGECRAGQFEYSQGETKSSQCEKNIRTAEGRKVGRYESINVPSERRDDAPSPVPDAQTDIEDFTGPAEILPPQPSAPPDARTALFTAGLKGVRALTGKPDGASRALLGRWLKTAKDDAAVVNSAIRGALDVRPADPVAWIEGAVRSRGSGATRQQAVRDAWAGVPDIEGV